MNMRGITDLIRNARCRICAVAVAFGVVFAVLVCRAVDLQLVRGASLSQKARQEFLRQVEIPPRRGAIYDRNLEELAVSLDTESVCARPLQVMNVEQTANSLAKALGLSRRLVRSQLTKKSPFVWIARRVDPMTAQKVRELDLEGVGLVKEPRRFYPATTLACHVLGFAGLDSKGLEGLEARWDSDLRGEGVVLTSLRDALGQSLTLTPEVMVNLPEGNHLVLTLDKRLQYFTEKVLAEAVTKFKAISGQAVVMDPRTGEILAMANVPVFNPNVFAESVRDTYRNRVVTDTFEPGSTFKTFLAAAALVSGRVTMDQTFDCEDGAWRIGRRTIHDTHEYQHLTLSEIVKVSSNIGAAKVAQVVGRDQLFGTLEAFGFGQPTGVDLPGEVRGVLRAPQNWREVEMANIAFGQGVSVTGLQLVQAMGAIANNGLMMKPHVVRATTDSSGRLLHQYPPAVVRRALGTREARLLTQMLVGVTQEGGTGQYIKVEPFTLAGKTGTAQKIKPGGGYSHSDYISSFLGFLPAEDPRAVILVAIDNPRGSHYGAVVAGPAWAQIARRAMDILGVQPQPSNPLLVAQKEERALRPAMTPAMSAAEAAQTAAAGQTPDLRGFTLREVMHLAAETGFTVQVQGWGRVVEQSPPPGETADAKSWRITLRPMHGGA